MKKLGFLLVALFALWACSDDDTTPEQEVACEITAPVEGTVVDLAEVTSMTIKGEGTVNIGKIESVVLKVNDKLVSDVNKVPFSYEYVFAAEQAVGTMKIELTVKGDAGKEKTVTTNVTLKKTEPEQEVACEITAPAADATFDLASVTEMAIAGKASVNVGSIASISLKVGGVEVSPAPVLAEDGTFAHTYAFAKEQVTGDLLIELAVKGDRSETPATVSVKVALTKTELPVEDGTFVDSRDGHTYKFVTIGTQDWMAENLAYLPKVHNPAESVPVCDKDPQYFILNYNGSDLSTAKATKEYQKYGVLYNWYAAMGQKDPVAASADAVPSGVQGVCPAGWHLPSKAEWQILENFVAEALPAVKGEGQYIDLGFGDPYWMFEENCKNVWGALAGKEDWEESAMGDENPDLKNGAQDIYGFNIIPSGTTYRVADFQGNWFKQSLSSVCFWTTDEQNSGNGYVEWSNMNYRPIYSKWGSNPIIGNPVRCVRDKQ